ncbi:MAG: GNAT family N-acetyltransferase [Deltaproteobacteria bacterium]|nr:GNAT family N-acetyltransferase [Deltaproteobacteria bacterium]
MRRWWQSWPALDGNEGKQIRPDAKRRRRWERSRDNRQTRNVKQGSDILYTIRPVVRDDEPFLWEMLYYAAHMDEDGEMSPDTAKTNPDLAPYVTNWGRTGDLGVVAVESESQPMGAAWLRQMPSNSPLYRFVDTTILELAVAVLPAHINKGAGTQLLTHLLTAARMVYPAVVLSVRANNPAKQLYERLGFVVVAQMTNRVGGASFVMKVDLG